MKVTKEYLRKVIKETLRDMPQDDGSTYVVLFNHTGYLGIIEEKEYDIKQFSSLEAAKQYADQKSEEMVDDPYDDSVEVFKLVYSTGADILGTMDALDKVPTPPAKKKP